MFAEVGFLVVVLYFVLFLDVYNALVGFPTTNGRHKTKYTWVSNRNVDNRKYGARRGNKMIRDWNDAGRDTTDSIKEILFPERLPPRRSGAYEEMHFVLKSRLWGSF